MTPRAIFWFSSELFVREPEAPWPNHRTCTSLDGDRRGDFAEGPAWHPRKSTSLNRPMSLRLAMKSERATEE